MTTEPKHNVHKQIEEWRARLVELREEASVLKGDALRSHEQQIKEIDGWVRAAEQRLANLLDNSTDAKDVEIVYIPPSEDNSTE